MSTMVISGLDSCHVHSVLIAYIPALAELGKHAGIRNVKLEYGCDEMPLITATFMPNKMIKVPEGLLMPIGEREL